jgi:exosortase family protein XrtF
MGFSNIRPVIGFLLRFFVVYLLLSLLYSWFISRHAQRAGDPFTYSVTHQVIWTGGLLGNDWKIYEPGFERSIWIMQGDRSLVRMFEGCNGVSVMILFVSFLFGLSVFHRAMLWFIPLGLGIIHLANLIRIHGLILVHIHRPEWTGFVHKYLFTLALYAIVFVLWIWWVRIWKDKRA